MSNNTWMKCLYLEVTRGRVRCLVTFYLLSGYLTCLYFGYKQSLEDFYNFTPVKCNSQPMIGYNFLSNHYAGWEKSLWKSSNLQIVLKCHKMLIDFSFTNNSPTLLYFSSYQSHLLSLMYHIIYLLLHLLFSHQRQNICLLSSVSLFNWFSADVALVPKTVHGQRNSSTDIWWMNGRNICFQEWMNGWMSE